MSKLYAIYETNENGRDLTEDPIAFDWGKNENEVKEKFCERHGAKYSYGFLRTEEIRDFDAQLRPRLDKLRELVTLYETGYTHFFNLKKIF